MTTSNAGNISPASPAPQELPLSHRTWQACGPMAVILSRQRISLRDTTIELFKSGEPGVPTVHQFLNDKLQEGMCLGFDGRTVSAREAEELQELLQEKHITFSVNDDLIGEIWEDRPVLSCEPVMELDIRWTGKSRADKIAEIREQMKAKEADTFILTSLDDIAWLLNIRGNDIHCCPVVLSYLVMMENELRLYANAAAFSEEIRSNLEADGVKIYPYDDVYSYVQSISSDKKVLLSRANVNSRLVSNIPSEVTILDEPNLTLLPKAVKNETEMENERIAHIKDGVAVTKFIHWLKKNVTRTNITELSTAEKLYQFRSEQEHFLGKVLIRSLHMERMLRSYITARQKRQTSRLRPGEWCLQIPADIIWKEQQISQEPLFLDLSQPKKRNFLPQFCVEI